MSNKTIENDCVVSKKTLLKRFKTEYCKLILVFVKNVKAEINENFGKAYYGKVLKAKLTVDDIKVLFKVWDESAEMILNRDVAFFDRDGVLFDFYSVASHWSDLSDDAVSEIWIRVHKLYMMGKGIIDNTDTDASVSDSKTSNGNLLDWSKLDIANMVSSDITPLIDNVRQMDAASRRQGKNLAREMYGNVIKHINSYVALSVPKYSEKIIIKMFKSVINTVLETKSPAYASDVIPEIMAVINKFSDNINKDKRFTKEFEELLKKLTDDINKSSSDDESKDGNESKSPFYSVVKALLNSEGDSVDGAGSLLSNFLGADSGIDIGDDLKDFLGDEEALEEKATGLLTLIKDGVANGNVEEVLIEWLHDNAVILNMLRTQFPSVEFLKQGRKPKSKKERLQELLKQRREKMASSRKSRR